MSISYKTAVRALGVAALVASAPVAASAQARPVAATTESTVGAFLDRLVQDPMTSSARASKLREARAAAGVDSVSKTQLLDAASKTVACIKSSVPDVEVTAPTISGGVIKYSIRGRRPAEGTQGSFPPQDVSSASTSCRAKHLDKVERVWLLQELPIGARRVQMVNEVRSCLTKLGVDGETQLQKGPVTMSLVSCLEGKEILNVFPR